MADAPRLPHITAMRSEANRIELDLVINADLFWFHGHFAEFPILPGVVQLDWALSLARQHLGLTLEAGRNFQVKYKAGIFPDDRLVLNLVHQPEKDRLSFDYRRDGALCSSGQVNLAP